MPVFGLTTTGFVPQPLDSIREEIIAAIQVAWGPSLDLGDRSPLGHFVGIVAERLAALWELAELVNAQQDPDAATGTGLAGLCALTGTFAPDPAPSTVVLTLTGNDATSVPSGSQAATTAGTATFETTETVALANLTAWAITTAYVVGDRRSNASRSYICITAGTSAGSGGPTTTAADITDGGAHWRYMGEGTAVADAHAACTEDGPTIAVAFDISEIITAVGGWSSVINLLDADLGRDQMTDEQLRLLREAELATPGTGTADAIRAALLALEGVTSVTVFVNDTDSTDSDGMPPHSVEALVRGGEAQDIYDVLLRNVVASQIASWCFAVPGVLDVTDIDVDDAPAPAGSATVPISTRQLAVFDTSRITVASSATTP